MSFVKSQKSSCTFMIGPLDTFVTRVKLLSNITMDFEKGVELRKGGIMNFTQPKLQQSNTSEKYSDIIANHINRSWPSVNDGASIEEVAEMLAISPFCGYPVVNDAGLLIGFITEKECLKYTLSEKYYHGPSTMVAHYMTRNAIVFSPNVSLLKALEVFIDHPFHAYPVVDSEGKYLGCASRKELLRVALRLKESVWHEAA